MLSKAGKTLTIFVVLVVILLLSSTCIGFYLYHQEERLHKSVETDLDNSRADGARLQTQLKDVQAQLSLAMDKNKEADQKINNLLDEQDLNEGLRTALKKENADLKSQMDSITKANDKIKAELDDSNAKLIQYQDLLKDAEAKNKDLETHLNQLQESNRGMAAKLNALKSGVNPDSQQTLEAQKSGETVAAYSGGKSQMELDKIVVNPQDGTKGHVLSVDADAQFVIFNLGSNQGIKTDNVLSIYRGTQYIGDIKATRVQDEMSAADFIPPLSGSEVQKNDIVVLKP